MNEIELRQEAVRRFLAGEKPQDIGNSLQRSRQWVYSWAKRFTDYPEDAKWFEDKSKAPKHIWNKTTRDVEEQILLARERLDNQIYAQKGAISIQYELRRIGIKPPPLWTINRILFRNGLNKRSSPQSNSLKEYPAPFIRTHQMDLVGPRYLRGDGRFYSLNIIDTETHWVGVFPIRTKSSGDIAPQIVTFWKEYGLPDALQMDNELAFRGSNRYPRSFSMIVRLALSQGVVPVFIPEAEPWRNGIIEKFNGTFDKRFFRSQSFESFEIVKLEAPKFSQYHNYNHRYSANKGKTPWDMVQNASLHAKLPADFELTTKPELKTGFIYFIRFIRSDLKLRLPTERFTVDKSLIYSYVVAEINVEKQMLFVKQNNEVVQTFTYLLPLD
jgi:transposase InsO family protein